MFVSLDNFIDMFFLISFVSMRNLLCARFLIFFAKQKSYYVHKNPQVHVVRIFNIEI